MPTNLTLQGCSLKSKAFRAKTKALGISLNGLVSVAGASGAQGKGPRELCFSSAKDAKRFCADFNSKMFDNSITLTLSSSSSSTPSDPLLSAIAALATRIDNMDKNSMKHARTTDPAAKQAQFAESAKNLCREGDNGVPCKYGKKCKFKHPAVCRNWSKFGKCKFLTANGSCKWHHIQRFASVSSSSHSHAAQASAPTGVCYQYRDTGICSRGKSCKFLHTSAHKATVGVPLGTGPPGFPQQAHPQSFSYGPANSVASFSPPQPPVWQVMPNPPYRSYSQALQYGPAAVLPHCNTHQAYQHLGGGPPMMLGYRPYGG